MLKFPSKICFTALLVLLLASTSARAETKVYQYDGKLPFVQMMLNMMSTMGIIDRLPSNGGRGGFGQSYNPYSSWSNMSNPYSRAMSMQGLYGDSPFMRSPWMGSPWSQSGDQPSGASPVWGSPSWGVLPYNSHATNSYSPYGYSYDNGASDLSGWVNEPWEESAWNSRTAPALSDRERELAAYNQGLREGVSQQKQSNYSNRESNKPPAVASVPLVQNFNYSMPPEMSEQASPNNAGRQQQGAGNSMQGNRPQTNRTQANRTQTNRSPLAKLMRPNTNQQYGNQAYPQNPAQAEQSMQANRQNSQQKKQSPLQKRVKPKSSVSQGACITEFCGLKIPNLNGLWVAQSGEMLGVKNNRYLWSDGDSRYLTGQLKIQNEYLLANVDGHEKLMRFKYKLAGNQLLTMQPDGVIREFVRMPRDQYQHLNTNRGYGQRY